jgi:hypothetical protein
MSAEIEIEVTTAPAVLEVELSTGAPGLKGEKGDRGDDGSDASVTSANITSALGFTPDAPTAPRNPTAHTHAVADVTGLQSALDGKQAAGTYATLIGGTVPASQLPSYVDDVLEFATLAAFPATGETGKIYVATGSNKTYRWSGSSYVEIASSPGSTDAVTEGSTNLYFTAARAVSAMASTLASYATQAWVTAQGFATPASVSSAISALVTGVSSVAGKTGAVTLSSADVTGLAPVATSGSASDLTSGTLPLAQLDALVSRDNQNNSFTAGQSITAAANTSALTASYSVTGANTTPLLDLSGTWNTTGIARGILLNVTDTASAGGRLLDLQVGGTSYFTVFKPSVTSNAGGFSFTPGTNTGTFIFDSASTSSVNFKRETTTIFSTRADAIRTFNFGSAFAVGWNGDTYLNRDAANTLALRNGGTAGSPVPQTFRLYNYTDAGLTNFERGFMRWNSNTLEIGTEAGGTGTNRSLNIRIGTQTVAQFYAAGSGTALSLRNVVVGAGIETGALFLKVNGATGWQCRNLSDNAFRAIQGQLTTDTAYTATTITPTGFLTIYDSTGTAYKVACSL